MIDRTAHLDPLGLRHFYRGEIVTSLSGTDTGRAAEHRL